MAPRTKQNESNSTDRPSAGQNGVPLGGGGGINIIDSSVASN